MHGLTHATGEFVIIGGCGPVPPPLGDPVFVAEHGARVRVARRGHGDSRRARGGVHGWDTRRKLTSRVANYIAHVLLAPGVSDLTGSFRLYRKDAMLDVIRRVALARVRVPDGNHGRCVKARLKVREVPISFVDRVYGSIQAGKRERVGYLKGLLRLFLTV